MRLPMTLTFTRLLLIPVFVLVFYLPSVWANFFAAIIFALAGITDWLDGYLARRLKQSSAFGAFLDPVADKLMVVIALIFMVSSPYFHYTALPAAIIAGREITVSGLREWMAELGKRASVAVSYVSKVKTTMQIVAIVTLLAATPIMPKFLTDIGYILLYIAAGLTLWTMCMYLKAAWPDFTME
ncbi:MAG: CDP-diacylglycerol--glycerol-3-phosphate 3-phosphatidyltransferase [Pseudomonadota bacterium]